MHFDPIGDSRGIRGKDSFHIKKYKYEQHKNHDCSDIIGKKMQKLEESENENFENSEPEELNLDSPSELNESSVFYGSRHPSGEAFSNATVKTYQSSHNLGSNTSLNIPGIGMIGNPQNENLQNFPSPVLTKSRHFSGSENRQSRNSNSSFSIKPDSMKREVKPLTGDDFVVLDAVTVKNSKKHSFGFAHNLRNSLGNMLQKSASIFQGEDELNLDNFTKTGANEQVANLGSKSEANLENLVVEKPGLVQNFTSKIKVVLFFFPLLFFNLVSSIY